MADSKITALTAITTVNPATYPLVIVDTSDTSMAGTGTTKKVTTNQLLGSGGTATLASATITGDLTVRTNKLYVTATGVGCGMTPITPLSVSGAGGIILFRTTDPSAPVASPYLIAPVSTGFSSTSPVYGYWYQSSGIGNPAVDTVSVITASSERYRIAADGVATWSNVGGVAGTAMTLNSTGLGVGGSPLTKIFASVTPPGAGQDGVRVSDGTRLIQMSISGSTYSYQGIGANQNVIYAAGNPLSILSDGQNLRLGTSTTSYVLLDTSGNVGISVQPSVWFSTWKVLQLAGGSFGGPSDRSFWFQNAIVNASGQFQYVSGSSTPASGYRQFNGAHDWYTAAAGTSPNQIADFATPKMTLESTGSLVLGAAAVATTATDGFLYIPGCAGTPTGTPTAKTGRVPLVVDTTNNKLYFYSGGAWVAAN